MMSDNHPKPIQKSRNVVVESVYHQPIDGPPVVVESKYAKALESEDQPYGPRRVKIGTDWTLLDTGWVKDISILTISNDEGRMLQVIPNEVQLHLINSRIVEMAYLDESGKWVPVERIHAGESRRGRPLPGAKTALRCLNGTAKVTYTAFPV